MANVSWLVKELKNKLSIIKGTIILDGSIELFLPKPIEVKEKGATILVHFGDAQLYIDKEKIKDCRLSNAYAIELELSSGTKLNFQRE